MPGPLCKVEYSNFSQVFVIKHFSTHECHVQHIMLMNPLFLTLLSYVFQVCWEVWSRGPPAAAAGLATGTSAPSKPRRSRAARRWRRRRRPATPTFSTRRDLSTCRCSARPGPSTGLWTGQLSRSHFPIMVILIKHNTSFWTRIDLQHFDQLCVSFDQDWTDWLVRGVKFVTRYKFGCYVNKPDFRFGRNSFGSFCVLVSNEVENRFLTVLVVTSKVKPESKIVNED